MTAPYVSSPLLRETPEVKERTVEVRRGGKVSPFVLALPLAAASVYDAETTFGLRERGGREANPLMRPFVERGRPATYAALLAQNAGLAAAGDYLKKKGKKYWWAPQALGAIGHLVAGTLNRRKQ